MRLSKVGIVDGLFGEDLEMLSPCKEHGSEENGCNDLEHVSACEMIGIVCGLQEAPAIVVATIAACCSTAIDQRLPLHYGQYPYPHDE